VASKNITEVLYERIRSRILQGEWAAGDRLPAERILAAELGTNRNTLREAIRKLEQDRLVSVRHGQGVTILDYRQTATLDIVAPFLESDAADPVEKVRLIQDLLFARSQVLEMAVIKACERAEKEDVVALIDASRAFGEIVGKRNSAQIAEAEMRWLNILVSASHSLAVRWTANSILSLYQRLVMRFPAIWVFVEELGSFIGRVTAAIEAGDVEVATALTRSYYRRTDMKLLETLQHLFVPSATSRMKHHG